MYICNTTRSGVTFSMTPRNRIQGAVRLNLSWAMLRLSMAQDVQIARCSGQCNGTLWYSEVYKNHTLKKKTRPKKVIKKHCLTLETSKMWWMVGNGHEWPGHELILISSSGKNIRLKTHDQKGHEKCSKWHFLSPCISSNFQPCQGKQRSEWPTDCLNSLPSIPQT